SDLVTGVQTGAVPICPPRPRALGEGQGKRDPGPRSVTTSRPKTIPRFPAPTSGAERERLRWLYRTMLRIRAFDERIVVLFAAGQIGRASCRGRGAYVE